MRGSHLPPNFGQSARLVLEHFKPKLHDLFRSFARRQLPGPTDAKVGSGTTRLKERTIWKQTQELLAFVGYPWQSFHEFSEMMFIISDAKSYSHADFLSIKCASLLFSSLSHIGMHVCCYTSGHCCPNLVPIPTGQSLEAHQSYTIILPSYIIMFYRFL